MTFESWGKYPKSSQQAHYVTLETIFEDVARCKSYLPFGLGRSYGDSCLSAENTVLVSARMDHFISFDKETGVLRCEAGVSLKDILNLVIPHGWFLPTTPGTKFVTIAGAIANDVHGKNHSHAGSFGCHVRCFELLRSDGQILLCSAESNADYFAATIGGLGLTGYISWAEIQLKKIDNAAVHCETIKYSHLRDFFRINEESLADFEYTVAWLDCTASGEQLGRGHYMRANHAKANDEHLLGERAKLIVPITPPISVINKLTLKAFNALYYHRQRAEHKTALSHYDSFFYQLDALHNWNRIHGPAGFQQYQCVVPPNVAEDAIAEILRCIARSGEGSPMIVLKTFGDKASPGMLSFPRPGATLALDFPMRGDKTLKLFKELDTIVCDAKGALYPAKDAHMSAEMFAQAYPSLDNFKRYKDPACESLFWRRVMPVN